MKDIYSFEATTAGGETIGMEVFAGEVLLIVNVASKCGFTSQYAELEALHERFGPEGFSVLGFPCNQFGGQEPGSDGEIQSFCRLTYGVSFPVFAKVEANGPHAHPLFLFLRAEMPGFLGTHGIKWNFTKFLVNRQGKPVRRFAPTTPPRKLVDDIQRLLVEPVSRAEPVGEAAWYEGQDR